MRSILYLAPLAFFPFSAMLLNAYMYDSCISQKLMFWQCYDQDNFELGQTNRYKYFVHER